jgi:hypothetical protein
MSSAVTLPKGGWGRPAERRAVVQGTGRARSARRIRTESGRSRAARKTDGRSSSTSPSSRRKAPEVIRSGLPAHVADREYSLIETVAVRHRGVLSRLPPSWRHVCRNSHRWRLLGGFGFALLSLGACVLVARLLSGASWPLDGARASLVFVAGGCYFASFGFRALGWQRLFPSRERPDRARCLAACGSTTS